MTMVPRTGPRSASSALRTSSLYQAEKSSLWGVTPRFFSCCLAMRETLPGGLHRLPRLSGGDQNRVPDRRERWGGGQVEVEHLVDVHLVPQRGGEHIDALGRALPSHDLRAQQ